MKAVVYTEYGPADVLQLREIDKPVPDDDEVLIKTHAAEPTRTDCELRRFNFQVNWFWLPLRIATGLISHKNRYLEDVIQVKSNLLARAFQGFAAETGSSVNQAAVRRICRIPVPAGQLHDCAEAVQYQL